VGEYVFVGAGVRLRVGCKLKNRSRSSSLVGAIVTSVISGVGSRVGTSASVGASVGSSVVTSSRNLLLTRRNLLVRDPVLVAVPTEKITAIAKSEEATKRCCFMLLVYRIARFLRI